MAKASKDYSRGKVYMIRSKDENCVSYVGSTTKQYLSQRMDNHRNSYKQWKKGKHKFISVFQVFEKYGIENCYIELLESCPCKISEELLKKEREHIEKIECVNLVKRVIITKEERVEYDKEYNQKNKEQIAEKSKEYREANKEEISERMKIYREANKEEISERMKIYREANKEEISEKKKEYAQINKEQIAERMKIWRDEHKEKLVEKKKEWYEENREQISERKKETYECPCGSICRKGNRIRHEKSKKHQEYLTTIGTLCSTAVTQSS